MQHFSRDVPSQQACCGLDAGMCKWEQDYNETSRSQETCMPFCPVQGECGSCLALG